MNLSDANAVVNKLSEDIRKYLDNPPKIEGATYEQQQDIKYILDKYNEVVQLYSNLLDLQREVDYFISLCKKGIKLIPGNSELELAQKGKLKSFVDLMKELSNPLSIEKERLKTIEMFYRSICQRRDF